MQEVIIRAFIGGDGDIIYDIYVDPSDELTEAFDTADSDDGGSCTSGLHVAGCEIDGCDGCSPKMDKPHDEEDWKNALDMAVEQAVEQVRYERVRAEAVKS